MLNFERFIFELILKFCYRFLLPYLGFRRKGRRPYFLLAKWGRGGVPNGGCGNWEWEYNCDSSLIVCRKSGNGNRDVLRVSMTIIAPLARLCDVYFLTVAFCLYCFSMDKHFAWNSFLNLPDRKNEMQKRKTRNQNDNISPRERACLYILVHAWVRLHQMSLYFNR